MRTPIYTGLFQSDLDAAGYKVVGLPTPSASNEAATKGYVDAHAGGGGGGDSQAINVKSAPYSATGDGVTDDTVAIQSAINAASTAGGGTVFFPMGTYLCNGAFDGTTNSILKFPFIGLADPHANACIALVGETPVVGGAPVIKSTKTGTGTTPAIIAAGAPYNGALLSSGQLNFTFPVIKNLVFIVPSDPTIGCLRLETASWAHVQDLWIDTATYPVLPPVNGAVGVWMPNSGNGGQTYADRVFVRGFYSGFRVGEHFRAPHIFAYRCNIALEFLAANNGPSWVNLQTMQPITDIKFWGYHSVNVMLDTEHAQGADVFAPGTSIVDPGSIGRGEIKYQICTSGVGPVSGPLTTNGGTGLTMTDFNSGITTIAPIGNLYIGTDARLTPVSGGVKLEARNTGTGVWVEAARWTNP